LCGFVLDLNLWINLNPRLAGVRVARCGEWGVASGAASPSREGIIGRVLRVKGGAVGPPLSTLGQPWVHLLALVHSTTTQHSTSFRSSHQTFTSLAFAIPTTGSVKSPR
jgi:hypothetical protein